MEFSQEKSATSITFAFHEQGLQYSVEDASGRSRFVVPYEEIPSEAGELVEKNVWYRNAAFFWMLIGIAGTAFTYLDTGTLGGYFWLVVGLITYVVYRYKTVTYSVFRTSSGPMYVIKDEQHDPIICEILHRKRDMLRERYGALDLNNEPEVEMRKFRWLMQEGAITEGEYHNLCRRIRFTKDLPPDLRGGIHLN